MESTGASGARRAAVLLNTARLRRSDEIRAELGGVLRGLGCPDPVWLEAGPQGGVVAAVKAAVDAGAEVVVAGGGDGTVRAVAAGILGTPAALGILPLGTGNVLARNLGIPQALVPAARVAMGPGRRRIDLGQVDGQVFAVTAGIGFDAILLAGAAAAARSRLGLPAYVVAGLGHLGDPAFAVEVSLDGAPAFRRSVAAVLVSNVPHLRLGITLQESARPDDGLLEVTLVEPRGVLGWPRVAASLLGRRRGRAVERFQASAATVRAAAPVAREVDGDPIAPGPDLSVRVLPLALEVCVPAGAGPDRPG